MNAIPLCFYTIDDLSENQVFTFEHRITPAQVDAFAALSGDHSPLHMNEDFARKRGFPQRVVHGMFLGALLSRLVGMHFPGANAILQSVNMKFLAPVYAEDTVYMAAHIDQISRGTATIVIKVVIENGQKIIVARATLQVGFTQETS